MDYPQRLTFLQALLMNESPENEDKTTDLSQLKPNVAAEYIACYLTFQAIKTGDRSPAQERERQFDILSVYQCFALMVYAFISTPLKQDGMKADLTEVQVVLAKTLFSGLPDESLVELIESGVRKFQLIGQAEHEHWTEYREMLDKASISYVVAATDDDSPHDRAEVLPLLTQLLSQLCEAFEE